MATVTVYQSSYGMKALHEVLGEMEPGPSELFAAGFVFDHHASVPPNLLTWYHPGVCHVWAAYSPLDMDWKFRSKSGNVPSPVFSSVSALLVWMRVEGWLNG